MLRKIISPELVFRYKMVYELLISSIGYALFFTCCWYFLYKYRYDLNSFYKGRYLLYQELIIVAIHTESSILLAYTTTREINTIASYMFLISHYAFFITYFLFLYRMIILNKIEFGKIQTSEYPSIYKKLIVSWNIKITIVFTVITSVPSLTLLALFYPDDDTLYDLRFNSTNPETVAFICYFYSIQLLEYLSYCYLLYYAFKERFRLTIKIDLFLNLLIWTAYNSAVTQIHMHHHYSILLPLRNLSLQMIIIISFFIRSKFVRIPDPPLYNEPYIFLYEHRLFYTRLNEFLETLEDTTYRDCLELGMYISMYRFQRKEQHLILINNSCAKLELPLFDNALFINTEIFIKDKIESIFSDFFNSDFYQSLSESLSYHSNALYL